MTGDKARINDILRQVEAGGIETIRLVFTDPHGILRGKTLTASALPSAFSNGIRVPSTLLLKDLSHRTVFPVWLGDGESPMRGASDMLLRPVAESFRVLPWSPHSALIHCDVCQLDGMPVEFSSRRVLSKACETLAERGLEAVVGLEVEFQLFEVVNQALEHDEATMPGRAPQTRNLNQGYQFLTETRYDACEDILDKIRRAAQSMGMDVRTVEIEMGPSQFEFTFAPENPMQIAEMAVNFKMLVKEICHRDGLLASFMPKPKLENAAANGWHIHQSVCDRKSGENLLIPERAGELSPFANNWVAGLLENATAACLMTNPVVNSYKRFGAYQLAPNQIGWGVDNRGAMVRAITEKEDPASRVENRLADSAVNPYFALAAQLVSGIDGVKQNLSAAPPLDNPYAGGGGKLPENLGAAIDAFERSESLRSMLGDQFVDYLAQLKRAEWNRYLAHVSDWEQDEYFANL